MGDGNPCFCLPFQLLLVAEVKIGSCPLRVCPPRRQRPACLSLSHLLGVGFILCKPQHNSIPSVGWVWRKAGEECVLNTPSLGNRTERLGSGHRCCKEHRAEGSWASQSPSVDLMRGCEIQTRPIVSGSRPPFTLTLTSVGSPPRFCFPDHRVPSSS